MEDQALLERITLNPYVMMGKPVIKGDRLTVEVSLNLLAHGATTTDILDEYNGLKLEDIQACLLFAGDSLSGTDFMPLIMGKAWSRFVQGAFCRKARFRNLNTLFFHFLNYNY